MPDETTQPDLTAAKPQIAKIRERLARVEQYGPVETADLSGLFPADKWMAGWPELLENAAHDIAYLLGYLDAEQESRRDIQDYCNEQARTLAARDAEIARLTAALDHVRAIVHAPSPAAEDLAIQRAGQWLDGETQDARREDAEGRP